MIHTDLKPENVVISLTQDELREIKKNGCLATTKAMKRNKKLKERAVAGANGEVLVSTRNPKSRNILTDRPAKHPSQEKFEQMDPAERKKYKKKKRKREKKYMKQGKLPENYDSLAQEEKDKLYFTVRSEISGDIPPSTAATE